jgi:hypothetical protein
MKNTLLLSLILSLLCFAGITYAANSVSGVKIDNVAYKADKGSASNPSVTCDLGSGTTPSLSFSSAKRGGKAAFVSLNFNLTADEYNNLKAGDILTIEHGDSFSLASASSKVLLIFSESSGKKSKTKITSVSKGSPSESESTYMVDGSVEILNKRADGCLDVSFTAMVQNAPITMSVVTLDPKNDCIKDFDFSKVRSVPSTVISGSLYPVKFSFTGSNSSGSSMLCNTSTSGSTSGTTSSTSGFPDGSSSGFTIPDFGSSSGFTFPPGFGTSGSFGTSSGFTIPDFPEDEGTV